MAALKAGLKPEASCKRDGKIATINASELVPGDLVLLGSGGAVPADCMVNHGEIEVDQAALTGAQMSSLEHWLHAACLAPHVHRVARCNTSDACAGTRTVAARCLR